MFIGKLDQKEDSESIKITDYIGSNFGYERTVYKKLYFEPGSYIAIADIEWGDNCGHSSKEFSVSVYSQRPVVMSQMESQ